MSKPLMPIEAMNERIQRSPFNRWLGLEVVAASADEVKTRVGWRPEMAGSPDSGSAHGGVLAAIIDATASYVVAAALGRVGPTLDMRVDYHKGARPGDLHALGRVVKAGRTIATIDVAITDAAGTVLATGRAVFFVQTPDT